MQTVITWPDAFFSIKDKGHPSGVNSGAGQYLLIIKNYNLISFGYYQHDCGSRCDICGSAFFYVHVVLTEDNEYENKETCECQVTHWMPLPEPPK